MQRAKYITQERFLHNLYDKVTGVYVYGGAVRDTLLHEQQETTLKLEQMFDEKTYTTADLDKKYTVPQDIDVYVPKASGTQAYDKLVDFLTGECGATRRGQPFTIKYGVDLHVTRYVLSIYNSALGYYDKDGFIYVDVVRPAPAGATDTTSNYSMDMQCNMLYFVKKDRFLVPRYGGIPAMEIQAKSENAESTGLNEMHLYETLHDIAKRVTRYPTPKTMITTLRIVSMLNRGWICIEYNGFADRRRVRFEDSVVVMCNSGCEHRAEWQYTVSDRNPQSVHRYCASCIPFLLMRTTREAYRKKRDTERRAVKPRVDYDSDSDQDDVEIVRLEPDERLPVSPCSPVRPLPGQACLEGRVYTALDIMRESKKGREYVNL